MKKFTIFVTAVFAAAAMLTIASCGKNDKDKIKNIEKPTHSATADQAGDFKAFADAVEESDKTIDHLQKTKEALLSSENQLRLANNKAEDLSIKKLTKNAPSVRAMFEQQKTEGSDG